MARIDVAAEQAAANRAYSKALFAFAKGAHVSLWDVLRDATFDLMQHVQLDTPIDTGRARAGWTPFFKALGVAPASSAGDPVAVAQGETEGSADLDEKKLMITIQNRVPYIIYLEAGWSGQAPQGFARRNLRRHAASYRDAARKMKIREAP